MIYKDNLICSSEQPCEVGTITVPILKMTQRRLTEVKYLPNVTQHDRDYSHVIGSQAGWLLGKEGGQWLGLRPEGRHQGEAKLTERKLPRRRESTCLENGRAFGLAGTEVGAESDGRWSGQTSQIGRALGSQRRAATGCGATRVPGCGGNLISQQVL